jgi:hypothetical protein
MLLRGLIYMTSSPQVDENRLNKVLDFLGAVMYNMPVR